MSDDPVYREICNNIRVTDDISFKLLGFVPLISGAGIAILLSTHVPWSPAIYLISLAGAGITFGFFRWELRNMLTCNWLIRCAAAIELRALKSDGELAPPTGEHVGQYYRRPEPPGLFPGGGTGSVADDGDQTKESPPVETEKRIRKKERRSTSTTPFGKAQAEKLVYSLTILTWLSLPWIIFLFTTPEKGLERTSFYLAVAYGLAYGLLATFLGILTVFGLRANVRNVDPMESGKAKKEISSLVVARPR